MELMIAWYPAAKLAALLIVLGISIFLYKKKLHTANIVLGVVFLIFMYLMPVKIDGTEGKKYHLQEVIEVNNYHDQHDEESIQKVEVKKLTFDEKMALEDARSVAANARIKKEIEGK